MRSGILPEQAQYYRERTSEYDEWFIRQGRYDRGEKHRQQWFSEVSEVAAAIWQYFRTDLQNRLVDPFGNGADYSRRISRSYYIKSATRGFWPCGVYGSSKFLVISVSKFRKLLNAIEVFLSMPSMDKLR